MNKPANLASTLLESRNGSRVIAVSRMGNGQMRFPWFTIDLSIINLDCGSHLRTRQPSFGAQQGLASRADGFTLHGQLYEICNHMLTLAYTVHTLPLCRFHDKVVALPGNNSKQISFLKKVTECFKIIFIIELREFRRLCFTTLIYFEL